MTGSLPSDSEFNNSEEDDFLSASRISGQTDFKDDGDELDIPPINNIADFVKFAGAGAFDSNAEGTLSGLPSTSISSTNKACVAISSNLPVLVFFYCALDYDILFYLLRLVKLPALEIALSGGAPFTLFAPTDQAFISTAQDLGLVKGDVNEAVASRAIENALKRKGDVKELVTTILNYHFVPRSLDFFDVGRAKNITTFARSLTSQRNYYTIKRGNTEFDLIDNSPDTKDAQIMTTGKLIGQGL